MNIKVYIATGRWRSGRLVDANDKRQVEGEDTATPGLAITPEPNDEWKVTHEGSGYAATCALPKHVARLIAGAMGGLGIDWKTADMKALSAAARNLPFPYYTWLKNNLKKEGF